ncbi:hypothetical protein PF005_g16312 [Phytophthora fragariae]|uniref:Uncharacterized protein n=1 Tax=Phytophthora fragariae TaxID=53985 RepID=A0A6A3X9M7_9STRA|nr:hypothetical protein PF005_g16312 [Phytophthora fragariae]
MTSACISGLAISTVSRVSGSEPDLQKHMARGEKRGPDDIESSTSKHRRAAPPPPAERHRRRPPTRSLDTRYKYLYPLIVVESALAPVASEPTWFVAVVLPLIVVALALALAPDGVGADVVRSGGIAADRGGVGDGGVGAEVDRGGAEAADRGGVGADVGAEVDHGGGVAADRGGGGTGGVGAEPLIVVVLTPLASELKWVVAVL